jgi:hypothetical protein
MAGKKAGQKSLIDVWRMRATFLAHADTQAILSQLVTESPKKQLSQGANKLEIEKSARGVPRWSRQLSHSLCDN